MKANMMQRPKSLQDENQGAGGGNHQAAPQNDFEMMFAEDTAIVVISGNKDSQAKIMKTNNGVSSFAMLRAGHIFAINLIVKPVPSLKNDIQYISLIKPSGKDYDYILTD